MANPLGIASGVAQGVSGIVGMVGAARGRKKARKKMREDRALMRRSAAEEAQDIGNRNTVTGIQGDLADKRVQLGIRPQMEAIDASKRESKEMKRSGRLSAIQEVLGLIGNAAGAGAGLGMGQGGGGAAPAMQGMGQQFPQGMQLPPGMEWLMQPQYNPYLPQ